MRVLYRFPSVSVSRCDFALFLFESLILMCFIDLLVSINSLFLRFNLRISWFSNDLSKPFRYGFQFWDRISPFSQFLDFVSAHSPTFWDQIEPEKFVFFNPIWVWIWYCWCLLGFCGCANRFWFVKRIRVHSETVWNVGI